MGCASLKKRAENFTRKIGFVVASTSRSQDLSTSKTHNSRRWQDNLLFAYLDKTSPMMATLSGSQSFWPKSKTLRSVSITSPSNRPLNQLLAVWSSTSKQSRWKTVRCLQTLATIQFDWYWMGIHHLCFHRLLAMVRSGMQVHLHPVVKQSVSSFKIQSTHRIN